MRNKMHPLTEILFDDWHMNTGKDVMDLRIRIWLTEKVPDLIDACNYKQIQKILELPEVVK